MAQAQALDDYFRRLERELDCPAKYRSELVARARKRAEDYLLDQSDAGSQDMDLLLGDPKELAQSILETLDPDELSWYRAVKARNRRALIALAVCAFLIMGALLVRALTYPLTLQVSETLTIYQEESNE